MPQRVPVRPGLFVEGPDGWRLIGSRCRACGQSFFPKAKAICLNCESDDLEEVLIAPTGTLYSWAPSNVPTAHFRPPFTVGYVTLENGVRIGAQLIEAEGKPFRIGMPMRARMQTLWQDGDTEVFGYRFEPA